VVQIVNVVASGHVGRELDLSALQRDIDVYEKIYEPERFPGLQLRFKNESAVLILYSTGSYSIMGAKSEEDLNRIYNALSATLDDLGIDIKDTGQQPEVRNLICTTDLDQELNLSALTIGLGLEQVEYEPEQSPFLYYRPTDLDCLITIPTNGKVTVTGIEKKEQAEEAFNHLRDRLSELFESQ
jgi:transcription initiation factor TFIID TATA-box-binding protein